MLKEHTKILFDKGFIALTENEFDVIHNVLNQMESFSHYRLVVLSELFGYKGSSRSYLAEIHITQAYGSSAKLPAGVDWANIKTETIVVHRLNFSSGHVFIRPKTMFDKIIGIITANRIRIKELSDFDKRYYLVSENESWAHKDIMVKMLKVITPYEHIFCEIRNEWAVLRRKKPSSSEEIKIMLDIAQEINAKL